MLSQSGIVALAIFLPAAASLSMLAWLFRRHIDGQPLIAYVPRRRVPWNVLAPIAVLAPLLIVLAFPPSEDLLPQAADQAAIAVESTVGSAAGAGYASPICGALEAAAVQYSSLRAEQDRQLPAIWSQIALFLLLLAACLTMLTKAFGATAVDLGLPQSWTQFRRDVALGVAACIAALVPVYGIHLLLTILLEPDQGHPLIEELVMNPSLGMMIAGAIAAMIAAPMFEEVAFRLTFQGWLERCEDAALHLPEDAPVDRRTPGVIPALQHGWSPILISAMVFGLAHGGQGVAPASIVVLGVVLGYLYQRTHRIVPSIACHMTFNALSLGSLLLHLALSSQ